MTSTTTDTRTNLGEQFLSALGSRDFDRIETLFSDDAAFRALTPSSVYEVSGPTESVGLLRKWMGNATEFEIVASTVEPVVDRLHVSYRIRLWENDRWSIVEQKTYCRVEDDRIAAMNLVCSGFRPVDTAT